MELKGQLSSLPLTDLLQLIDTKGHSGCLHLSHEDDKRALHLRKGILVFSDCLQDAGEIGHRLMLRGLLPPREYMSWKRALLRGERKVTSDFLPNPDLPAEDLQKVFDQVLQDEGLDLFSWEEGEFEFESENGFVAGEVQLNMPISEYLSRAKEWAQKWKRLLEQYPGLEEGMTKEADFPKDGFSPTLPPTSLEWQVLAAVNGKRNLPALATASQLSLFDTGTALAGLIEKDFVQWTQPENPEVEPQEEIKPESEQIQARGGLLKRLRQKDRVEQSPEAASAVSLVSHFENRLLELWQQEAPESFDPAFLTRRMESLQEKHPLMDWLHIVRGQISAGRFEREPDHWGDPGACEPVIVDSLDALRDLVNQTFERLSSAAGEKKALQIYRREYDAIFRPEVSTQIAEELSWLHLAR
jgi:hypothetical protein